MEDELKESLLSYFTPEQVRLMADRWDELREELTRWVETQDDDNGESIHFYRPAPGP